MIAICNRKLGATIKQRESKPLNVIKNHATQMSLLWQQSCHSQTLQTLLHTYIAYFKILLELRQDHESIPSTWLYWGGGILFRFIRTFCVINDITLHFECKSLTSNTMQIYTMVCQIGNDRVSSSSPVHPCVQLHE